MVRKFENTQMDIAAGCSKAYVDGSYDPADGRFSYGVVFFTEKEEIHISKAFSHEELSQMRNVAGEIMGAAKAMKTAHAMGLEKLTIYHDYEGIAKWCTGSWKAKKTWTQKYKSYYEEVSEYVKISFVKVAGHSGDKYNDLADNLAKEALSLYTAFSDSGPSVRNI